MPRRSFILSKSPRLQGVDWENGASLGMWMQMYRPGDLWLWQQWSRTRGDLTV